MPIPDGVSNVANGPSQAAQLALYVDGSVFAGASANPGSVAYLEPGLRTIAPGETFTVNASAQLTKDANNEWQGKTVTAHVEVISQQVGMDAPKA